MNSSGTDVGRTHSSWLGILFNFEGNRRRRARQVRATASGLGDGVKDACAVVHARVPL